MRQTLFALLAVLLASGQAAAGGESNAETAAIQGTIDAYVAAFNAGDAATLAKLWTEHGEMIGPMGDRSQGRAEIQEQFADYFAKAKGAKLELADTTIELQSPSTAVETGLARVLVPDQEPSETEYRAVHVKTADGWRIDGVRETELALPAPSHYEQLQELAWMVGEWSDAEGASRIESNCRWSRNQNFLIQSFHVTRGDDDVEFEGTQIIGWDPQNQTVRSWLFDSDGGFGAGRWSQQDGRWTATTLQVLPDGRAGSATNIYERVDDDTVRYRSIGRQVEGELLPSIGPVTIVRKK